METKYVRVPFDIEMAKKITNGEVEGKVVTRNDGNARIICWDAEGDQPIIALIKFHDKEYPHSFYQNGSLHYGDCLNGELMLEIPEYMTFKDGDVVVCGWSGKQSNCKWINLIKDVVVSSHGILTHNYATLIVESNNEADGELKYNDYSNTAAWIEKSTESEKQKLIEALKASKQSDAKECLKILGVEVKQEYEFKPFDKVLVRNYIGTYWVANIFSNQYEIEGKVRYSCCGNVYNFCIPYNDQTKHLLGTNDNWEK